ncbi:MAG: hypothetical protein AB8H79_09730 [Myxococcota bacterium]
MDGSAWALISFLAVSVVVAAWMLWPRMKESVAFEDPVVVEAVDALHVLLAEAPGHAAIEALATDVRALRADREQWHARLREDGVSEAVHVALDRV